MTTLANYVDVILIKTFIISCFKRSLVELYLFLLLSQLEVRCLKNSCKVSRSLVAQDWHCLALGQRGIQNYKLCGYIGLEHHRTIGVNGSARTSMGW
jgi:hypothetical protein